MKRTVFASFAAMLILSTAVSAQAAHTHEYMHTANTPLSVSPAPVVSIGFTFSGGSLVMPFIIHPSQPRVTMLFLKRSISIACDSCSFGVTAQTAFAVSSEMRRIGAGFNITLTLWRSAVAPPHRLCTAELRAELGERRSMQFRSFSTFYCFLPHLYGALNPYRALH